MKDKSKKILKKFAPVAITMAITATIFAGCNQNGGQTNKPVDPIDPKPPVTQTEISVAEVLADVERYNNFDFMSSLSDVAVNVVEKNVEDEEATPLSFAIENDNFVVVAENENGSFTSVTLPLSEQCKNYVKNNTTKQNLVLRTAGLLASDMIKESEKDATIKKITDAIEEIETNVAGINDAQPSQINDYVAEGEEVNLSKLFEDKRSIAYIREDNSVVAFVFDEDKCKMTMKHFVVEGAENMTNAEIVAEIINGTANTASTNLRFDEDFTLPPLQKPIVETITALEIMQQVFANFTPYNFEAKAQEIVGNAFSRDNVHKIMFYSATAEGIRIYSQVQNSRKSFCETVYTGEAGTALQKLLKCTSLEEIASEFEIILTQTFDKNSQLQQDFVDQLTNIASQLNSLKSEVENIQKANYKGTRLIMNTEDISNYEDYAKKLFPGKQIVAAYVGDMGPRRLTPDKFSDTSYSSNFEMAFVIEDKGNFEIHQYVCFVPNYENGTSSETLYLRFLNSSNYILEERETTTISNPIVVKQTKASATAYSVSLPVDVIGDVCKTYEMVDAVSQTFAK